jgi:hypothetical protein
MIACYSRTIHTLPSDSLCLCIRTAFAFELLLPSKYPSLCHRRTFASEGRLPTKGLYHRRAFQSALCPLKTKGLCLGREFAIVAFAIVGPLPSNCPCLSHRSTFAFGEHLPSWPSPAWHFCLQTARVFAIALPLPSRGLCLQRALAFVIDLPLPSWGLCLQTALAFAFGFAIDLPLPSKGLFLRRTFAIVGHLPSYCLCLCHRRPFAIVAPLPSNYPCRCHRLAFAIVGPFAFKVPLPLSSKGAIEGPLPSKGLCHRGAYAIEGPLPSKCPCLSYRKAFPSKFLCLQSPLAFAIERP